MPGGRLLRGAAAASMVSSARTNRAVRKNIEAQNDSMQNQASSQDNVTADPAEEIKKYKGMLDDGLITQEEFDAKKKQILGI